MRARWKNQRRKERMVCRASAKNFNRLTVYRPANSFTPKNTMLVSRRRKNALFTTGLCLATAALLLAQAPGKDANGQKPAGGSPASPAEIEQGKKLFNTRCAICHYSASPAKKIGPGLKGLAKRGTYADGKPVDDASLREWIEKGSKNMPGFKAALNAEQIRELVVYLKTL